MCGSSGFVAKNVWNVSKFKQLSICRIIKSCISLGADIRVSVYRYCPWWTTTPRCTQGSPWSSTPSWRDRRISKNSGWFRFENFFNRKSNIWHMYHRQKKRSCKESSVRWRRRWGSWTGQSINSSPTQYFCSLFILLLFSSCGSHSLCWLHWQGPIGGRCK